jgi:hypothetical protein
MVIEIPASEKLEKVNRYTKISFKPFMDCNACSAAHEVVAAVFPPLSLPALTQRATSGQGTACSFSAALRVRREYLN